MANRPAVQAAIDAFAKELEAELALERARAAHHDARVKLADVGDRRDFTEYLMATNKMEDQERAVYETPDEDSDEPEPEPEDEPEDEGDETAPKDPTPPKTPAKKSTSNRRRR